MECFKKIGLLLCISMLMLQGCVTNTLDDCPEAIRYALAFKYTLHTDRSNRPSGDRFCDDVDKMFVYVFDATTSKCVFVDTLKLRGPFGEDYTYPISLNIGKYDIIAWGWGRNPGDDSLKVSTAIIPLVIPGTTTIDNARLQIEKNTINGQLEKIFYSEMRDVNIPAFISRVDTMPLMNISNLIRVVIKDAKTAKMQDEMDVSITSNDGVYFFDSRSPSRDDSYGTSGYFRSGNNAPDIDGRYENVTYLPYKKYRTDSILKADPIHIDGYSGSGRDSVLVLDMSLLRLVQDNQNTELVVDYNGDITKFDIIEILQTAINRANLLPRGAQYHMDRYHRWQISISKTGTNVTVTVSVLDWHLVLVDRPIGDGFWQ